MGFKFTGYNYRVSSTLPHFAMPPQARAAKTPVLGSCGLVGPCPQSGRTHSLAGSRGPCGLTAPSKASCPTRIMGWESEFSRVHFGNNPEAESEQSRLQTGAHSQVSLMPFYSQLDDRFKREAGRTWRSESMKTAFLGLLLPE